MYNTSFLAIGLYLHASGQYEDYKTVAFVGPGSDHLVPGDPVCCFVLDASLTRAEFANISPTWVGSQGWSDVLDYILLCIPISPPPALIHSSSPFPSDHFPISLSLPLCYGKQEPELWETKRHYHLPEKIPPAMRQRFNACFGQHIPPDWEDITPSENFHFIQTSILHASEAVFGPPGDVGSTPSVVITQQRALSNFLLKTARWWSTLRHVLTYIHTFLQLREQVHSA